jgi:hypothetical protein
LKALEADRRLQAEHERVLAERDRLAEEMERMAEPIAQIAHTVSKIAICDREIGRLNATSTSRCGYIRPVLSGAAPAVVALFLEGVVWDTFIAVARLAIGASCILWGWREGQRAPQANSRFASGNLAEVEWSPERTAGGLN